MPLVGVATLPGAPLSLPSVTGGIDGLDAAIVDLQAAAAAAVAGDADVVVMVDAEHDACWDRGDLTLAGFGLPEAAQAWAGDRPWADATSPLPIVARVLVRHAGPDRVRAVLGVATVDMAQEWAATLAGEASAAWLVACGDLSAGVGSKPPRPDGSPLARASLAGAVAAARHLACPLVGRTHVARGVATFVGRCEIGGTR